jgi:hypothetical protein
MIDKQTLELAKKYPQTALSIIKLFRFKTDREKAVEILKDNGVVLDWSGHHPRELKR